MTGFGASSSETEKIKLVVEVKTLNSKTLDASIRLPRQFSDKELEVRNILGKELVRGKVNLNVDLQKVGQSVGVAQINTPLVQDYYQQLKSAAELVGESTDGLFRIALTMTNAIENVTEDKASDDEWQLLLAGLTTALEKCNNFRKDEGEKLTEKFNSYITVIDELLKKVIEQDPERIAAMKKRISDKINEAVGPDKIDNNRFEQELIYYIEKLDITEEKVRLKNHINYFREVMATGDAPGKKLGFIGQEIGREINTIGSKANDATIQQLVVNMKEELEKIKEQVLNIL